ncbi:hypothetical protein BC833DRAFT_569155 [Globomyces pollinis-pini]|nr:hypothetical protein BC833DRAFT_569155 [Globomyces pollinis-pini]
MSIVKWVVLITSLMVILVITNLGRLSVSFVPNMNPGYVMAVFYTFRIVDLIITIVEITCIMLFIKKVNLPPIIYDNLILFPLIICILSISGMIMVYVWTTPNSVDEQLLAATLTAIRIKCLCSMTEGLFKFTNSILPGQFTTSIYKNNSRIGIVNDDSPTNETSKLQSDITTKVVYDVSDEEFDSQNQSNKQLHNNQNPIQAILSELPRLEYILNNLDGLEQLLNDKKSGKSKGKLNQTVGDIKTVSKLTSEKLKDESQSTHSLPPTPFVVTKDNPMPDDVVAYIVPDNFEELVTVRQNQKSNYHPIIIQNSNVAPADSTKSIRFFSVNSLPNGHEDSIPISTRKYPESVYTNPRNKSNLSISFSNAKDGVESDEDSSNCHSAQSSFIPNRDSVASNHTSPETNTREKSNLRSSLTSNRRHDHENNIHYSNQESIDKTSKKSYTYDSPSSSHISMINHRASMQLKESSYFSPRVSMFTAKRSIIGNSSDRIPPYRYSLSVGDNRESIQIEQKNPFVGSVDEEVSV